MFSKFSSAYKIVSNFGKIQAVLGTAFVAMTKTVEVLEYLLAQPSDTKLGKLIGEYLPPVVSILSKIIALITKYGPIFGFETANLTTPQSIDRLKDLKDLDKSLDELLK